jgi:hypothetical protein
MRGRVLSINLRLHFHHNIVRGRTSRAKGTEHATTFCAHPHFAPWLCDSHKTANTLTLLRFQNYKT